MSESIHLPGRTSLRNPIPLARRATRLSAGQWLDLAEATWFLGWAAIGLSRRRFESIIGRFGSVTEATDIVLSEAGPNSQTTTVRWSIETASRYSPWRTLCLCEALAGGRMLARRHIEFQILLGTRRDADNQFEAHAWLIADIMVTGGHRDPADYDLLAMVRSKGISMTS